LKHVRARIDRPVKTCSIKRWWRRRRHLLLCDRLAGLKRNSQATKHKRDEKYRSCFLMLNKWSHGCFFSFSRGLTLRLQL
jgi:hypothetical protein